MDSAEQNHPWTPFSLLAAEGGSGAWQLCNLQRNTPSSWPSFQSWRQNTSVLIPTNLLRHGPDNGRQKKNACHLARVDATATGTAASLAEIRLKESATAASVRGDHRFFFFSFSLVLFKTNNLLFSIVLLLLFLFLPLDPT